MTPEAAPAPLAPGHEHDAGKPLLSLIEFGFSELPEGFDYQMYMKLHINLIAAAYELPVDKPGEGC